MKKISFTLAALLSSIVVVAHAEPASRDIVANPDPDKVAEVERHAQELKEKQDAAIDSAAPTAAGAKHKAKHHKHNKAKPKTDGAPSDTPAAMPQ